MMKKIMINLITIILLVVISASCQMKTSKEESKQETSYNIVLDKSSVELGVGESTRIVAIISPSTTNVELVWRSSDTSIFEIDQQGNVLAKKIGEGIIVVESKDGKIATCNVAVIKKTGSIRGTVQYGSRSLGGAWVFVFSDSELIDGFSSAIHTTETNSSGVFEISNLPVGTYYVQIRTFDVKNDRATIANWYGDFYYNCTEEFQNTLSEILITWPRYTALRTEKIKVEYNTVARTTIDFGMVVLG